MRNLNGAIFFSLAATTAVGWGQSSTVDRPDRGVVPYGVYSSSETESINQTTGSAAVRIPLAKVQGRNGAGMALDLVYNSNIYNLTTVNADATFVRDFGVNDSYQVNALMSTQGGGWRYSYDYRLEVDAAISATGGAHQIQRVNFVEGNGTTHRLWLAGTTAAQWDANGYSLYDLTGVNLNNASDHPLGSNLTYFTADGSFIRLEVAVSTKDANGNWIDGTWTARYPDGSSVSGSTTGNYPNSATSICDRNSNCTSINRTVNTNLSAVTQLTDSFGRMVVLEQGSPITSNWTDQIMVLQYGAPTPNDPSLTGNQSISLTTTVSWRTANASPTLTNPQTDKATDATQGVWYKCQQADDPSILHDCLVNNSFAVVSQIQLPNGLSYLFNYADNMAGAQASQGELMSIQYPAKATVTPATVQYNWSHLRVCLVSSSCGITATNAIQWFDANRNPVKQKQVTWKEESDGGSPIAASRTWSYAFADGQSTITAPDGGFTSHYFYALGATNTWNSGLIYKTTVANAATSPTATATTWRCWQQNAPPSIPAAFGANPHVMLEFRQLPGASAAATWFDYDKNGNLYTKKEFDWSTAPSSDTNPCAVPSTVLRTTQNQYYNPPGGATVMTASGAAQFSTTNAYWNANGAYHKRNSLLESRVSGAGGATAAVSQFDYDDPNTKGNVLHEYHWDNQLNGTVPAVATSSVNLTSSNASVTSRTYDGTYGLLISETDPNLNVTQYSYGAVSTRKSGGTTCPIAFAGLGPTSKTGPAGRVWNYFYDCATGMMNDVEEVTNKSLLTSYGYDSYGRQTSETVGSGSAPAGRSTVTSYDDSNRTVTVTVDGKLGTVSHFNGMGRQYLARETPDKATAPINAGSSSDIRTVMTEAGPGDTYGTTVTANFKLTSNPYLYGDSIAAPDNTPGWTLEEYDPLGRLVARRFYQGSGKPAPFGSNTAKTGQYSYSYSGNATTVTDPQGNSKATTTDALGRLYTVSEGGLPAVTYLYDALDNLTSVAQQDALMHSFTATQNRTFLYSSLGRLYSATNPETGTPITYTYFPNGALKTKTDGRGTTTYTIDALSRVLKKDYTGAATAAARYCYDGTKYNFAQGNCITDPARPQTDYPQDALTDAVALSAVDGSVLSQNNYSQIDALGRVVASTQYTAALNAMAFQYTYAAGGALAQVQYPSGRQVSYSLNGANRASAVNDVKSSTSWASGLSYVASGAVASGTFGKSPGLQFTQSWDFNSRLQAGSVAVGSTFGLKWIHTASYDSSSFNDLGVTNNGNVMYERVQYMGGGALQSALRYYSYDAVNRLSGYSETGKYQYYGYDAFGNIWQTSASNVGSLRALGPSAYEQSGNVVNNRLAGTVHDASGNQTQLSAAFGTNAAYDMENRLVQVSVGNSPLVSYDYDAEGRRVRRTDANGAMNWYVYDANGQLAAEYGGANTGVATKYPVTDHLGSVRMWVDDSGNCVSRMDYAPFGGLVSGPAGQDCPAVLPSTGASGMMFGGKIRDADTAAGTQEGTDYFGARYYWASLGRFTSPDDAFEDQNVSDSQSWNLYSYVRNNPLTFTDPTGRDCVYLNSSRSDIADIDNGIPSKECGSGGGYWVNGTITSARFSDGALILSGTTNGTNRTFASYDIAPDPGLAALQKGTQMAEPGVNLAGEGLMAIGAAFAPVPMILIRCAAGDCDKTGLALAAIPGLPGTGLQRFVMNRKLLNFLKAWNRTGSGIGSGSLPDAIRHEIQTGAAVGGKFHWQKGEEFRRGLLKLLRDPSLDPQDKAILKEMLIDLQHALSTPRN